MSGEPTPRLNPRRLQAAYDLLGDGVAREDLPVGLLAVADRRETLRCEAYGPGSVGTDGIFLIASISKPIVATGVMQLVEGGALLLEDPVARYLPEFGANGKERVTLWHLLTHTSGMSEEYRGRPGWRLTADSELEGACGTHLQFSPGSRFEYCNAAFTVLGEVITRLGGASYQDYLRDRVLAPAGMVDTSFRPEPDKQSRVVEVRGFPEMPGGLDAFVAAALPAGGLFSTAADLIAFGQSFLNQGVGRFGRVLGPAAIRVMTALHTRGICSLKGGQETPEYWGLSWEKAVPGEARLLSPAGFGHGGMTGTYLWVDPQAGLVVVFLANRVGGDGRTRKRIVNAVMGALE